MKKQILAVFVALMLVFAIFTFVACSGNDSTPSTPQNNIDDNPSGNQGGSQQGGDQGGTQPSGGDNGQGNPDITPTPNPPAPTYTVVQSTINLGDYTINIPDNAKSIGIVADIEPDSATTSADDDETHLLGYLAAFDEYNKLLTGKDGRISFTTTRKVYYKRLTETTPVYQIQVDDEGYPVVDENGDIILLLDEEGNPIPKLDENGNQIMNIEFLVDENGDYLYEEDENGDKIILLDNEGNYVFADDCEDEKEVLGEVDVELLQEDFGMSVIKIKVIRNFIFICFALPVPDECYETNKTYTMLLADGTVFEFTRRDLPALRGANDEDYDVTNYTSGLFTQSYVINLDNSKIYPLNGVNIAELNEYGYAIIDNGKAYDIRCLEDETNLSLIDISGIVNDPNTIEIHKDKNGIIYVGNSSTTELTARLFQNGTLPCVIYPDKGTEYELGMIVPYVLFDKKGNAYLNKDGAIKQIIGFDNAKSELLLSEKIYGNDENIIFFDNEKIIAAQYGYLITLNNEIDYWITSISENMPGKNLKPTDGRYELYRAWSLLTTIITTDINLFPGVFFVSTETDISEYNALDDDVKSYWNIEYPENHKFIIGIMTFNAYKDVLPLTFYNYNDRFSFYVFDISYNGALLDETTVQSITYELDRKNMYLNFRLFMGKDDSFNDVYYYGSVDLLMTELPESLEVSLNTDTPTRSSEVNENIIVIQPLN